MPVHFHVPPPQNPALLSKNLLDVLQMVFEDASTVAPPIDIVCRNGKNLVYGLCRDVAEVKSLAELGDDVLAQSIAHHMAPAVNSQAGVPCP